MLKYRQSAFCSKDVILSLKMKGLTMNHIIGPSNEKYNYGYIKPDFDVANAQMDEATVYYIKILTSVFFRLKAPQEIGAADNDLFPIDYDNVDLGQQFNGETLFSAALKNGYFAQAIDILKHIEPFYKATEKDTDNLNHRYSLHNILKPDDKDVIQKLEELFPYNHKGLFEDEMTGQDFAEAHQKAELIRRIAALIPLDFERLSANRDNGSWFGEFIKNKQFNLAEKYLKPYEKQYTAANILIDDLSLNDISVSKALREMPFKNSQSIFGRIHTELKKILPAHIYLTHILGQERYDLKEEYEQNNNVFDQNSNKHPSSTSEKMPQDSHNAQTDLKLPLTSKMPNAPISLLHLNKTRNTADNDGTKMQAVDMALFAWAQKQNNCK